MIAFWNALFINWYLIYSRNIPLQQERNPFAAKQSKMVSYIGVEFENNRNESFFDCRGYNCGISQFKGQPSTDIKRTFEERWLRLSNNKDVIMPDLYLARWVKKTEGILKRNYSKHSLTLETRTLLFRSKDEFEIQSGQPNHHDWTIQVLRSLDSESCHFSDVDSRQFLNVSKSGTLVDDTIYRNLIWQIRNAKRYFLNHQLHRIVY